MMAHDRKLSQWERGQGTQDELARNECLDSEMKVVQ